MDECGNILGTKKAQCIVFLVANLLRKENKNNFNSR